MTTQKSDQTKEDLKKNLKTVPALDIIDVNAEEIKDTMGAGKEVSSIVNEETKAELSTQVDLLIGMLLDPKKVESEKSGIIDSLGKKNMEMRENDLLNQKLSALASGGDSMGKTMSTSIGNLRNKVDELNPSKFDFKNAPGFIERFFRKNLGANSISKYFQKYIPVNDAITDIIVGLQTGSKKLESENTLMDYYKQEYREDVQAIQKNILFGHMLKEAIEKKIPSIEDKYVSQFLQEDVLLFLVQRINALEQARFVKEQILVSYELQVKTNRQLIMAVRNSDTTIEALRNAIIFNFFVIDAGLVADAIEAANETTSDIILQTAQKQGELVEKVFSKSVVAGLVFEKMEEAHNVTLQNLDNYQRLILAAIPQLIQESESLSSFNEKLEETREKMGKGNDTQKALFDKVKGIDTSLF